MKRTLDPDAAPAPVSGRISPSGDSGDADTSPRPSRGHAEARTGSSAADPPMPGQTELQLSYRQVTLWSL